MLPVLHGGRENMRKKQIEARNPTHASFRPKPCSAQAHSADAASCNIRVHCQQNRARNQQAECACAEVPDELKTQEVMQPGANLVGVMWAKAAAASQQKWQNLGGKSGVVAISGVGIA